MQIVHEDEHRSAPRLLREQGQHGRADQETVGERGIAQTESALQSRPLPSGQRPRLLQQRPERLVQHPEGDAGPGLVSPGPQNSELVAPGADGHPVQQRGLPDAGVAPQHRRRTAGSGAGLVQGPLEQHAFASPADELSTVMLSADVLSADAFRADRSVPHGSPVPVPARGPSARAVPPHRIRVRRPARVPGPAHDADAMPHPAASVPGQRRRMPLTAGLVPLRAEIAGSSPRPYRNRPG